MDDDFKDAVTATDTWIRLLFMILFGIFYSIAELVLFAVVLVQFFFVLFTREKNDRLLELGEDIGVYIFQVIQFVTFNSEEKPFPFGPWPYGADEGMDLVAEANDVPGEEPAEASKKAKKAPKAAPADDAGEDSPKD